MRWHRRKPEVVAELKQMSWEELEAENALLSDEKEKIRNRQREINKELSERDEARRSEMDPGQTVRV
jgi:hypothetical protein